MASQKSMHCTVMFTVALYFLLLQDDPIPSFPHTICLFLCRPANASSGLSSLIGWFLVRLQQFPDLGYFFCCLSHSACCFGHLFWAACASKWASSGNLLASRPRPAPHPALCVPPPCWLERLFHSLVTNFLGISLLVPARSCR